MDEVGRTGAARSDHKTGRASARQRGQDIRVARVAPAQGKPGPSLTPKVDGFDILVPNALIQVPKDGHGYRIFCLFRLLWSCRRCHISSLPVPISSPVHPLFLLRPWPDVDEYPPT